MGRILIVANDVVAERMAGPGIRCLEIGRVLTQAGHTVTLVGVGNTRLATDLFDVALHPSPTQFDRLARTQDVILLEGIALVRYPSLLSTPVPLVIDLYDPFPLALLEQEAHQTQAQQHHESREVRKVLTELLRAGDFFLCASEIQRDLWLGALLQSGRINPSVWAQDNSLRQLIDVVPFGLPGAPPDPVPSDRGLPVGNLSPDDVVLVWGGGIYNWFDPLTLIEAIGDAARTCPTVKLIFMSTGHPNPAIPEKMWMPTRAQQLSDELGLTDSHVFFNREWVPYRERARWLMAADCGVSTHFDHAETRFAFRTRMLDYLWAGLPIICTEGDYFADMVAQKGLGWVVPPGDRAALARAIVEMASNPERRREIQDRVRLAANHLTWDKATIPLVRFVSQPSMAPDHPRDRWIHQRPPSAAELRAREASRLLRRAVYELGHSGFHGTLKGARRWWTQRASIRAGDDGAGD